MDGPGICVENGGPRASRVLPPGKEAGSVMASIRQDPSHRPGPAGRVWAAGSDRGAGAVGTTLSVIVPAKNEAASLPQLIDEIAWALHRCAIAIRVG